MYSINVKRLKNKIHKVVRRMKSYYYLAIQSSYQSLQIGLFSQDACVEKQIINGIRASSHLIIHIDTMLKKHNQTLEILQFIAIDAGPGAFTSLRVAIATINGIGFSQKTQLIGVNGLEALFKDGLNASEILKQKPAAILCILNAYNNDAYFAYQASKIIPVTFGCKKINTLIEDIQQATPTGLIFVTGNGALTFNKELNEAFSNRLIIASPLQEVPSVERIAAIGYKQMLKQESPSYKIIPNYLKTQLFAMKKS